MKGRGGGGRESKDERRATAEKERRVRRPSRGKTDPSVSAGFRVAPPGPESGKDPADAAENAPWNAPRKPFLPFSLLFVPLRERPFSELVSATPCEAAEDPMSIDGEAADGGWFDVGEGSCESERFCIPPPSPE